MLDGDAAPEKTKTGGWDGRCQGTLLRRGRAERPEGGDGGGPGVQGAACVQKSVCRLKAL